MMSEQKKEFDFTIEPLAEEEEEKLFKLIKLCFGDVKPKFLTWKYKMFPGLKPENTVAVKKNHMLVGAVTLWPMKIKIAPDHTIDILVAGGGATHPNFRKRGIYTSYMRKAQSFSKETGSSLLIGYVNTDNITYKILPTIGMHELITQYYHLKILDYPQFFKDAIQNREFEYGKQFSKLSQKLRGYEEDILITPKDGTSFTMKIQDGKIKISRQISENPMIVLKGDIYATLFAKNFLELLRVLLTRKIKVWIPLRKIWRAFKVFLALMSVL